MTSHHPRAHLDPLGDLLICLNYLKCPHHPSRRVRKILSFQEESLAHRPVWTNLGRPSPGASRRQSCRRVRTILFQGLSPRPSPGAARPLPGRRSVRYARRCRRSRRPKRPPSAPPRRFLSTRFQSRRRRRQVRRRRRERSRRRAKWIQHQLRSARWLPNHAPRTRREPTRRRRFLQEEETEKTEKTEKAVSSQEKVTAAEGATVVGPWTPWTP